jgi:hypothetical protein
MTFIKFTHLRGNNLTNSAQATLKKKNLCGIQDDAHSPWDKYDTNLSYSVFVKILSTFDLNCQTLSFTIHNTMFCLPMK